MIKIHFMKNFNNYKSPKGKYKKINGLETLRSVSLKKIYKYVLWKDIYITWLIIGEMHRKFPSEIH